MYSKRHLSNCPSLMLHEKRVESLPTRAAKFGARRRLRGWDGMDGGGRLNCGGVGEEKREGGGTIRYSPSLPTQASWAPCSFGRSCLPPLISVSHAAVTRPQCSVPSRVPAVSISSPSVPRSQSDASPTLQAYDLMQRQSDPFATRILCTYAGGPAQSFHATHKDSPWRQLGRQAWPSVW